MAEVSNELLIANGGEGLTDIGLDFFNSRAKGRVSHGRIGPAFDGGSELSSWRSHCGFELRDVEIDQLLRSVLWQVEFFEQTFGLGHNLRRELSPFGELERFVLLWRLGWLD